MSSSAPNTATRRYAMVMAVVIAAVITAGGQVLAENWKILFPPESPTQQSKKTTTPIAETVKPIEPLALKDADWETLKPDVVYRAESVGFIAAYSTGMRKDDVKSGVIKEGPAPDKLSPRTRFATYDGTVLPVRRGRYWTVEPRGTGKNKSIVVQWLPLQ